MKNSVLTKKKKLWQKNNLRKKIHKKHIFSPVKYFENFYFKILKVAKNKYLYKIDTCTFRAQTYNDILFLYVILKIKKRAKCSIVLKISS